MGQIDLKTAREAGAEDEEAWRALAEERQQTHLTCDRCGTRQDILGASGYCCSCGLRSDFRQLRASLDEIQQGLRQDRSSEAGVRDAVSAFDGFAGALVEELVARVPLVRRRREMWNGPLHDLSAVLTRLEDHFGFLPRRTLRQGEEQFLAMMFHRRHLYEHKRGIVDERYLRESGDPSELRLGQRLAETRDNAFRLVGDLDRLARSLLDAFHELFPLRALQDYEKEKAARASA